MGGGGGRGVQLLFLKETCITCVFPGGGAGPLVPPLNPGMQYLDHLDAVLKKVINFEPP